MPRENVRKLGLVGFVAGVGAVAMASAAFACTETFGRITFTGVNGTKLDGTTNGSVTYYGNGQDWAALSNGYCDTSPSVIRHDVDTTVNSNPTKVEDFRLSVAPYTCAAGQFGETDRLSAGEVEDWEVRWVPAEEDIETESSQWPYPVCHFNVDDGQTTKDNPTSRWVPLGTMTVNDGSGSKEFPLPSVGAVPVFGPGNICMERSVINDVTTDLHGTQGEAPPVIFINKVNLI